MTPFRTSSLLWAALLAAPLCAVAQAPGPDLTCFQQAGGYTPQIDIASDMAVVYGCGPDFAARAEEWRKRGYSIGMMTGIAWGGYDAYYQTPDGIKKEEIQTEKDGRLRMHGHSDTVGYNVPTPAYVEYIKKVVEPAVDAGAQAIFLEEPEYWAETGWSEGFKRAWETRYGKPWEAPDSSVDAQYKASRLKYELYFNALREVFRHAKARAAAQGRTIECHVPTHSLVNYAQWRIVSPEASLMGLEEMDGYIAQVWTGTARTANMYRGVRRSERTFETGYLEYAQAYGMVRPTGRKVWFLADPVEDNPDRSWNDYKWNYECTIISSLMFPGVSRFEVMPWPSRIFQGTYPKVDLDGKAEREGIPAEYATQLLTVINALNDMDQKDVAWDTGTRGIGVMVSDTLMFQRAAPTPSDAHLSNFFGLAMPMVKHGFPLEIVQMENLLQPGVLAECRVLLLTYEGQKPLKPEYHDALAEWVRGGGALLFVDDGKDPYNHVQEWWNAQGTTEALPQDDLFARLGVDASAKAAPQAVGKGWVRWLDTAPSALARDKNGPETLMPALGTLCAKIDLQLHMQNYLKLRRGPYVIASVMNESKSDAPLRMQGRFIDLFDAKLPVIAEKTLEPDQRTLLYDLDWAKANLGAAKVAAAATRVREERFADGKLSFTTRGPEGVHARVRILLPSAPAEVRVTPETAFTQAWDAESGTLLLEFDNRADTLSVEVVL